MGGGGGGGQTTDVKDRERDPPMVLVKESNMAGAG